MNPLLAQILQSLQAKDGHGFGATVDQNNYTGQMVQPNKNQGYYMNMMNDPNQMMSLQDPNWLRNKPPQGT